MMLVPYPIPLDEHIVWKAIKINDDVLWHTNVPRVLSMYIEHRTDKPLKFAVINGHDLAVNAIENLLRAIRYRGAQRVQANRDERWFEATILLFDDFQRQFIQEESTGYIYTNDAIRWLKQRVAKLEKRR